MSKYKKVNEVIENLGQAALDFTQQIAVMEQITHKIDAFRDPSADLQLIEHILKQHTMNALVLRQLIEANKFEINEILNNRT